MSARTEIFEKVLEKLKLRAPVPDAIKKFALYNKPKSLISALKSGGEYSALYNFILKIYYLSGKSGLGMSIVQCKIILGLAAIFLCASIYAGAAVSYNYIFNEVKQANVPAAPVLLPDVNAIKEEPDLKTSKSRAFKKKTIKPAAGTNMEPPDALKEQKKRITSSAARRD